MTQMFRLALCATIIAAACGGGDPPGGGNGDTGDGGWTDGDTDTDGPRVPNPDKPLIDAIPGLWGLVELDGQPPGCINRCDCSMADCSLSRDDPEFLGQPCLDKGSPGNPRARCGCALCVSVDPTDRDCTQLERRSCDMVSGCESSEIPSFGPPGDACVGWFLAPSMFILDGNVLRLDPPPDCPIESMVCNRYRGRVLDNGTRIEYTIEYLDSNSTRTLEYQKLR